MPNFYFEKLLVAGRDKAPSSVEFGPGLNFVVGPSNTGKSYILEVMDYLFGFEERVNRPFRLDPSLGYDRFQLSTRTPNGTVVFERRLGETKIAVSGTDTAFEHGDYSISSNAKRNINAIWLQLIGVTEPHQIFSTKSRKAQRLSWRTMMHMFFIKQEHIARSSSVLLNPTNPFSDTPSQTSLLFLLTGRDVEGVVIREDVRIRTAKKEAVLDYIWETLRHLERRKSELSDLITGEPILDLNFAVDDAVSEMDAMQTKINGAIQESKDLMEAIYNHNGRLTECDTLAARFSILRTQYHSDIDRLMFVVEGESLKPTAPPPHKCPFCEGDLAHPKTTSYIEAARAELSHLRTHLGELALAEEDLHSKREAIQTALSQIEGKKEQNDGIVADELKPRVAALKKMLDAYRRAVELTTEIELIQAEERKYSVELFEIEVKANTPEAQFEIKEEFDRALIGAFEDKLITLLKAIKFEGYHFARFNMNTFDLQVAGRQKATAMGGGFCGLLNTVVALALQEYLLEKGKYAPGFLIADSPLSQLSESEFTAEADTMKSSFIQYLLNHRHGGQVIIVEQKEKLPFALSDYADVKVIEFTKNKEYGRYGFLAGVYA